MNDDRDPLTEPEDDLPEAERALGDTLLLDGNPRFASTPPATATAPIASTSAAPSATATAATAIATPRTQPTSGIAQISTLIICPDGSAFSTHEQPDRTLIDAETNEPRVSPAAAQLSKFAPTRHNHNRLPSCGEEGHLCPKTA